jgi:uncharacterized protein (DUF2141 family)
VISIKRIEENVSLIPHEIETDGRPKRWAVLTAIISLLVVGCIALVSSMSHAHAATLANNASLTVTVNGVAGNKGKLMVATCDKATFLKRCAYMQQVAAGPHPVLKFDGIAPGKYAVMVFHDENDNGQFDKTANGMPREGYGFSRNAHGNYGPPTFESAQIDLAAGSNNITIDLVY